MCDFLPVCVGAVVPAVTAPQQRHCLSSSSTDFIHAVDGRNTSRIKKKTEQLPDRSYQGKLVWLAKNVSSCLNITKELCQIWSWCLLYIKATKTQEPAAFILKHTHKHTQGYIEMPPIKRWSGMTTISLCKQQIQSYLSYKRNAGAGCIGLFRPVYL